MQGAATNAIKKRQDVATNERVFVYNAMPSDDTYTCEETNGDLDMVENSRNHLLSIASVAKKNKLKPRTIEYIDRVFLTAPADMLPYVCSAQFWNKQKELAPTANGLIIERMTAMYRIMELLLVEHKKGDEPYVVTLDCVLRAALKYNSGLHVVQLIVCMNYRVITHPSGPMQLLPVHHALLYKCDLRTVQALTTVPSVCRHRDFSGRTLLHWAVICDSPMNVILYLYEKFPEAIDCPTFRGMNYDVFPSDFPESVIHKLCGGQEKLQFSGGCTPLCLALDINIQKMPPRNNEIVIQFLVGKSVQSCMVSDDTGDFAFHKLLRGPYSVGKMKSMVIPFIQQHKQTAHAIVFVNGKDKCMLLELAFRLRLHADIIDMIGRFTSNMIEPMLFMWQNVLCGPGTLPPDEHRNIRSWGFLLHPLGHDNHQPMLPSCGLPWMPSNDNKAAHISDITTNFILAEDAHQTSVPLKIETVADRRIQETPVRFRKWTQLVLCKKISMQMVDNLSVVFSTCMSEGATSGLLPPLKILQGMQTTWYRNYKTELRQLDLDALDGSVLSEKDSILFFMPRKINTPLIHKDAERSKQAAEHDLAVKEAELRAKERDLREKENHLREQMNLREMEANAAAAALVNVRVRESDRHARELVQMLEDEEQSKQAAAAGGASRKSRMRLAQKERNAAANESRLRDRDAKETAEAIAQAEAAIVKERIMVEAAFAREAATRAERQREEAEYTAKAHGDVAHTLNDMELEIHRLEVANAAMRDARVSFQFQTMRDSLLQAEKEISDSILYDYAARLSMNDVMKVLEAEEAAKNILQPELRGLMLHVWPGSEEREAEHRELVALRAAMKEEKEARECVICFTNPKNVLLRPCMHMAICQQCYEERNIKECPICRGVVLVGEVYFT